MIYDRYYKDENTSRYKLCNESIDNCERCYSKDNCKICYEDFTKIDGINTSCHNISDLGDKYYPDPNDNSSYISCSTLNPKCITCKSSDICTSCSEGFGVYKEKDICVNITNNDYYKNDTDNLYYKCNETMKGCLKCSNADLCFNCDEIISIGNSLFKNDNIFTINNNINIELYTNSMYYRFQQIMINKICFYNNSY